ncbi:MAG: formate--tetrahydrofolate ligase [Candidatus Bipolaricaulia bacterium]
MPSDIDIAQSIELDPIWDIAQKAGLDRDELEPYGDYKAKVKLSALDRLDDEPDGRLVMVTGMTPTPLGEGKTVTTVGLGQAFNAIGTNAITAVREPSMGPVFGIKGGAAGGGHAQVLPMEDINLHFTGDMHAITSAHSLLSAMLDAHIKHGNELEIDTTQIVWKRAVDMNDRALRNVVVGLGGKAHGVPREDGYMITVASEIMAILCLARDLGDLKERLGRIIVAYNRDGQPVTAADLDAHGAMTALLRDAIKPNLVQTIEGTPAFVHGGPFANIAHGHNTLIADRIGLKLGDVLVTETGFGADLGAEKFYNIVCRLGGLKPDCTVVVATVRALKMHGYGMWPVELEDLKPENVDAVEQGLANLDKHIDNLTKFGVPAVVAVNRYPQDTDAEIEAVLNHCESRGVRAEVSNVWADGGAGGADLAEKILRTMDEEPADYGPIYDVQHSIPDKIDAIAKTIYGADGVQFVGRAHKDIQRLETLGLDQTPVCMAKTFHSLSDRNELKGAPSGWTLSVKQVYPSAGAGFCVALSGDVLTMPGLSKRPSAVDIDVDEQGQVTGLF